MAALVKYAVARAHQGDLLTDDGPVSHFFNEGDTRTADPAIVKHLVTCGVLFIPDEADVQEKTTDAPASKAERAPKNKAEPKPANKTSGVKPQGE